MDGLSIAVSTISILQVTLEAITFIRGPDKKKLVAEIINLCGLLIDLRQHVVDAVAADRVQNGWLEHIDTIKSKLSKFKSRLQELAENVAPRSTLRARCQAGLELRFKARRMKVLLEEVEKIKQDVYNTLLLINDKSNGIMHERMTELQQGVNTVEALCEDTARERLEAKLEKWLRLPDPGSNFDNAIRLRLPGTGTWLLNDPNFCIWRDQPGSFIWLYGKPGCGKTVLSSTVLEYIWKHCTDTQPDAVVIYYYFDFNDYTKRNTRLFVNYVLYNLCRRHPESFAELQKQYEAAINTSKRLSWDTATKLIHQTISRLPKTYIIVDALDECQDREPLLQFLRDLSISNRQQLHILATSRECDITERLKSHLTQKVDIKSAVVDRDIELYIAHLLKTDELLQKWRNISIEGKEAFKYIEDGLMKKADGMFRWVYCQIELIKKCKTPTKLQETLRGLPKTLDETYKRIIDAIIDEDEQTSAVRVLQWLCYSQRPLTLSEIVDALAVTPGLDGCFRPADRLVDPSDLTAICTSLITISDSKKGTAGPQVRLAHYSVQEYLLSERCKLGEFQPQRSNLEMAETCLQYLLHACRQPRHAVASEDGHNSLPLYSYSSTSWFNHVKLADPQKSTAVIDVAMRELFSQPEVFETWAAITRPGPRAREDKNLFSPLYYASWIGIPEIVQQLIMKGAKPDKVETVNGDMVPDCNLQCKVLDVAVAEGHLDVVRILLRAGADPNATGDGWGSPLQVASFRGLEAIVQVLLESGADATAHTGTNGTGFALHAAAEKGHPRIVKLLLDHGADPNQTGSDSGNALNAAALCGNKESVRELLKAGADPHVQTDEGNALQYAAEGGNVKVVQLLLDEGVDVNQVTENVAEHATALQAAAHEGHEGVVRLLLQHGADVNGPPGCSGSALRAAFAGCNSATVDAAYEAIINLLQDHNASDMPPRPQPAIRNRVMGRGAPAPLPPAEGLNMI